MPSFSMTHPEFRSFPQNPGSARQGKIRVNPYHGAPGGSAASAASSEGLSALSSRWISAGSVSRTRMRSSFVTCSGGSGRYGFRSARSGQKAQRRHQQPLEALYGRIVPGDR